MIDPITKYILIKEGWFKKKAERSKRKKLKDFRRKRRRR